MGLAASCKANDVKCEVNSRVQNATDGIVQKILPTGSVNHNAELILENSLYFMGVWEVKLDEEVSEFRLSDRSSVRVPFLTSKRNISLYKCVGFKVLELLYKKGKDHRQFAMSIFLPDGPDMLCKSIGSYSPYCSYADMLCKSVRSHSPYCSYQKVMAGEFKFPKFNISFGFEACQDFKDWILSSTSRGYLKRMVDSSEGDRLFVSSIHHRSVVEVGKKDTKAAAATTAVVEVEEGTEAATVTAAVALEDSEEGTESAAATSAVLEVDKGTEAATVTAAVVVEVVEGAKVATINVAVAVGHAEVETETSTVVSTEDDEEITEAATSTSVVSMKDEVGTKSANITPTDSSEDGEEGAESAVSMEDDEGGTETASSTSVVSMEDEIGTESTNVTPVDSLEDEEEGAEAAASISDISFEDYGKGTESVIVTSSDSMDEDEEETIGIFKVDRPFAFGIREEGMGGVVFAGYVLNPSTAVCNF